MAGTQTQNKSRPRRLWTWIRQHIHARILLPVVIGVGLAAYVINIAIAPKSGVHLLDIVRATWWIILLLTIPYMAIRAYIWRQLLLQLGIKIPWRPLAVSFAGGEITKFLPAGIYVENYLLARLAHFRAHTAVRSSMATTAMLGLEAFIALPILLVVGLPGAPWVRWVVVAVVGAWVALLLIAWLLVRYGARHIQSRNWRWLKQGTELAEEFLEAGGDLVTWQTVWLIIPAALYMLVYVADLYFIIPSVGIHNVSFADTMSIYSFLVMTVILIPIPTELGLTEFSGLAALGAFGISQPTAAIIMLGLRALATGMTIAVGALVIFFLRGELSHPDSDQSD